jgi:hypothetical protein
MITIHIERAGRSWTGRKLYQTTVESRVGSIILHNQDRNAAGRSLADLTVKLIAEDRPYRLSGITVL